jgi:crotonobetainyl-CoA:carnitine CoA-transferase CaiB-like acyl-CoA transferase
MPELVTAETLSKHAAKVQAARDALHEALAAAAAQAQLAQAEAAIKAAGA